MNFEELTSDEVDALDGYQREAFYAWRLGDTTEADRIIGLYETAAVSPDVETVVAKPRKRAPRKADLIDGDDI